MVLIVLAPAVAAAIAGGSVVTHADSLKAVTFRSGLEFAVMALQVAGVATLIASQFASVRSYACSTLVGVQFGLGITGALCAGQGSSFALFAGATMVVLFLASIYELDRGDLTPEKWSSCYESHSRF
jgi:hypothetical protein